MSALPKARPARPEVSDSSPYAQGVRWMMQPEAIVLLEQAQALGPSQSAVVTVVNRGMNRSPVYFDDGLGRGAELSVAGLVRDLRLSKRQVEQMLRDLVESGIADRPDGGKTLSGVYRLRPDRWHLVKPWRERALAAAERERTAERRKEKEAAAAEQAAPEPVAALRRDPDPPPDPKPHSGQTPVIIAGNGHTIKVGELVRDVVLHNRDSAPFAADFAFADGRLTLQFSSAVLQCSAQDPAQPGLVVLQRSAQGPAQVSPQPLDSYQNAVRKIGAVARSFERCLSREVDAKMVDALVEAAGDLAHSRLAEFCNTFERICKKKLTVGGPHSPGFLRGLANDAAREVRHAERLKPPPPPPRDYKHEAAQIRASCREAREHNYFPEEKIRDWERDADELERLAAKGATS